jgi:class 3 adenylate cyclase
VGAKLQFLRDVRVVPNALVVVWDLEGFSSFASQPDAKRYVADFLNEVFTVFEASIAGDCAWLFDHETHLRPPFPPVYRKFLGDGALLLWLVGHGREELQESDVKQLLVILWLFQQDFPKLVQRISHDIPLVDLPKRIRIAVSAGEVLQLQYENSDGCEYIGHALNLASRLQNYHPAVGFIVSHRVQPNGFRGILQKVVATRIKGLPREIVWVGAAELAAIPETSRGELFADVPVYHETALDRTRRVAMRMLKDTYIPCKIERPQAINRETNHQL